MNVQSFMLKFWSLGDDLRLLLVGRLHVKRVDASARQDLRPVDDDRQGVAATLPRKQRRGETGL